MIREYADAMRLEDDELVSLVDLIQASGLGEEMLLELVEYGALSPIDPGAPQWRFTSHCVVIARTAHRLQHDFELDAHALAIVLGFAERIERLEAQLCALQARGGR